MVAPCPEIIPFYYTTTLHVIATISVPINLIGLYMVWFQSPGMQGYKYCLCYMQTVSFLTEIHMSWICPGYYFFPMVGGYNTGEFFGQFISSHLSMSLWVGVFCFELAAGLTCFVYRHNAAAQINQTYSSKLYLDKFLLFLTHLFPFFTGISMWYSKLTYQQKFEYVRQNFPQCLSWLAFDGFEVYDYHLNKMMAVTGVGAFAYVFIIAWYCFYLGVHTMIILQRLRQHMSSQTFQMHRAALISLAMQMVIPGVFIIVPLDICMTVVITETVALQEFATDTMFMVGSHSMCQCSVMLLSNSTYRRVLKEKIFRVLRLEIIASSQLVSSVDPSMRTNSFVRAQAATPVA
ncbi:G protein-coupled receptor [Caenorhabditis elegans]|uniref:G protein-coupled receptor n=1 Tax=Caenorhabditis elegans TaxID=6239 RepID=O18113_CAEEL|nr:G protein-coupled receptor [Caenorhabditis elegans]CAB04753.3 G protein-coupled receptor [Caenorhabditis elegans]|eukprot:NP_492980.3 Serpentine Receptor, class I [Caenorhabditis elegans]